jgi:hypothetical protein
MSETTTETDLPIGARALLVGAGIDLAVFDSEIQFARIEAAYETEEGAA